MSFNSNLVMDTFGEKYEKITGLHLISYFYDKGETNTGTGTKIWSSSLMFNKWLVDNYSRFEGKNILELGAGTGAGGIALAKYKINHLTQTDIDPKSMENLKENIEINKDKIDKSKIDVRRLNYGKKKELDDIVENNEIKKYDIILGCDLIWTGDHLNYYLNAMEYFSKKYPDVEFILVNIHFCDLETLDEKIDGELKDKYDIKTFCASDLNPDFDKNYFYFFKRKSK